MCGWTQACTHHNLNFKSKPTEHSSITCVHDHWKRQQSDHIKIARETYTTTHIAYVMIKMTIEWIELRRENLVDNKRWERRILRNISEVSEFSLFLTWCWCENLYLFLQHSRHESGEEVKAEKDNVLRFFRFVVPIAFGLCK
jgi:hypothetical protein